MIKHLTLLINYYVIKHLTLLKIQKWDRYQRLPPLMVDEDFDSKASGGAIKS